MEIDPMENELDYPAKIRESEEDKFCPKCGKILRFDSYGAFCECGYKEQLVDLGEE